jgi:hypothetical protein
LGVPNVLTFSAQSLIEPAALFAAFLALLLYLRSLEFGHPPARALAAGTALGLAILTKYDHGGMLALALGLAELVRARFRPLVFARAAGLLLGVALVLVALWFAHPAKLDSLADSLRHPFFGTPRTILLAFALTWFVENGSGLAFGLLAIASFFAFARRLRDPALRAVWIWAALSTAFYALRGRFHFRYNFVEAPIFPLMAAVMLPEWIERTATAPAERRWKRPRIALALVSAFVVLIAGALVARAPERAYGLLRAPFAWFHGLRADHWGMRLAPGEYVEYFAANYAELAVYLGSSLAALALGTLVLSVAADFAARRTDELQRVLASSSSLRAARTAVLLALAAALLPGFARLYVRLPQLVEWELECHPELNEVYDFVRENVPERGAVLLGGGWDQLTNNSLRWYLLTRPRPGKARARFDEIQVGGDMIGSAVFPPEPRVAWWIERLSRASASELPERLVLVEPGPDFRYHARFGPEVALYRAVVERRASHRSIARREFAELGCSVEILAREPESAPIEPPQELLARLHVAGAESSRVWVGEVRGWDLRDDALRHFMRR